MKPTDVLKDEHRVIEGVLDCLEKLVERCRADGQLDAESTRVALDFFRNFADGCHHAKEEDQLFPLLEERGFPTDHGPVAVMRDEHEQGRRLIAGMDQAIESAATGSEQACDAFVRNALAYVTMLRDHIAKEDHCLFPMADDRLDEGDQRELQRSFERAETEKIGPEVSDRYRKIAVELGERLGTATRAGSPAAQDEATNHE